MTESGRAGPPPVTQSRGFWRVLGYAAILGVVGALAGLLFIGLTEFGSDWYGDTGLGWGEGHLWWVVVAAGAGLIVGLMRRFFETPAETPGIIEDLATAHVDRRLVPSIVAISATSLLGGASLGPEVALGSMGGGAADWISSRKGLDEDESKATALSGMSGAFAGLFSSPLLAMLLTLEIARPVRRVVPTAFFGSLVASSVSLGIYFALVGSLFIGIYEIPQYDYQDWHLLAGVGLGVLAAVIVMMQFGLLNILKKLFSGLTIPRVLVPVIGGTLFGLIGFALPLTNFTGSHQLATALQNLSSLGLGLLIAIMIGKMLAFAVAESTGFIGGPIFPILFVGGVSGMIVNAIVPGIPLGLAFTAMLAAVPGAVVSAPFSMVILAVLLTQVGAIQTGPILVAVGASSLTIAALRFLIAKRAAVATSRSDEEQAV